MRARLALATLALVSGCAQPQVPAPTAAPARPPGPPVLEPPPPANVALPGLLELRAPELRARFGAPRQARRDGGAEIWIYEAPATCTVNLVLQRERGGQKVVHAQGRLAAGTQAAACLRAIEHRK